MITRRLSRLLSLIIVAGLLLSGCGGQQNPTQSTTPTASPSSSAEPSKQATPTPEAVKAAPVPDWSKDATMYEVNVRQYTKEGTFKAFEQHLSRLKDMGIKILWFMPIYPISKENRLGTLGSYYSIADYTDVNPEFGTKEDFKALVQKAHEMGFKVMLDWVANHTGWDNKWVTEHPDWYTQNAKGQIVCPPGTTWTDVADLNYKNEDMRKAMIDAMSMWVKDFDVDGFRCDYASGVPIDFWNQAREKLEAIKPVYMLAEDDKSMAFMTYSFNANYGWSLYHSLNDIAKGTVKASAVVSYFNVNKKKYPQGTYPLNFIDNHDENSWNGTVEERLGQAQYPSLALIFTAPGMPLIYSGQEADLNKRLQFFEKDQIDWSDLKNEALIKSLIQLKKDHPALWNGTAGGDINFLETSDENVVAYERVKDGDKLFVLLNFSKDEKNATVKFTNKIDGTTFDTNQSVSYAQGDQTVTLKPWSYQIIIEK